MPIVYPHKTAMPCRDAGGAPPQLGRGRRGLHRGARHRRGAALPQLPGPRVRAGLPRQRADPRLRAPRRAGRLRRAPPPRSAAATCCPRSAAASARSSTSASSQCVLSPHQEPVGIGRLERFVADWERKHGERRRDRRARGVARPEDRDRRLGPGRPHGGQRPRAARLPRDDLRGAARVRRRPALRDPAVPAAEGDRRRGRRAPQGARRGVRARRDHRQDGHHRPAHRRVRLLGGLRRHRRGLADLHEHPRREPQGHLLGQRVPHPRQPDARVLVPRVRHAHPPAEAGRGDRRRRHRDGRGTLLDPPRRRGRPHRVPPLRAGEGRASRGLRAGARRGRDLRLAHPAQALPRRRARMGPRPGVHPHRARRARRVGPPPPGPGAGLGVHDGGRRRRHRPRHEPEPARPADDLRPGGRPATAASSPTRRPAPPAATACTPAATS